MRVASPTAFLVAIITSLPAQQNLLLDLRKTDLPWVHLPQLHAVGDYDADGDTDILVRDGKETLLLNVAGRFTSIRTRVWPITTIPVALASGDVDGDGDADVVSVHSPGGADTGQTRLFLANKAAFSEATNRLPKDSATSTSVLLVDVDGDRDLDLIVGNSAPVQTRLYVNNGLGLFADATRNLPTDPAWTRSLAAGDIDGDGDLDLFLGRGAWPWQRAANALWLNNGSGVFRDVSASWLDGAVQSTHQVAFLDANMDGRLDVIEINLFDQPSGSGSRILYQLRDGKLTGWASAMPRIVRQLHDSLVVADFDGDRDPDVLVGGLDGRRFFENNPNGFIDASDRWLPGRERALYGTSCLDFDGDGDLDLFSSSGGASSAVLLVNGGDRFLDARAGVLPNDREVDGGVAAGDLDGDGDLDLLFGNEPGNRAFRNDGAGFTDVSSRWLPASSNRAVALIDADGDGDLDCVFGRYGDQLYTNDGRGHFRPAPGALPNVPGQTKSFAVGDVDGDGDSDLVVARGYEQPNRLWINEGGRFVDKTSGGLPPHRDATQQILMIDVDRDSDLDLFVLNGRILVWTPPRLYLNDGRGKFQDASARLPSLAVRTPAAVDSADFDGDGDLDLMLSANARVWLWLNDGKGSFQDVSTGRVPNVSSRICTAADFDLDGDIDAFVGAALLLNDGSARFTSQPQPFASVPNGAHAVTVDFDRDGDPDVVTSDLVLSNRFRHVHATTLAVLGRRHRYYLDAEPSLGRGPRAAVLFVSPVALLQALVLPPFGLLHLHPRFWLLAGATTANPRGTIDLLLPKVNALAGLTLYAQALVLHGTSSSAWRLTNATADTIIR